MLQKSTAKLWQALSSKSELAGFVLIGGSALALHIHHRISEDLDFAWPYGRLPRESLQTLIEGEPSLDYVLDQNEVALREAEDANLDLADFAQNYLVNGVRVTFFSSYQAERRLLAKAARKYLAEAKRRGMKGETRDYWIMEKIGLPPNTDPRQLRRLLNLK